MRRVVVKLGGSLLDWPDLVPRLRTFLKAGAADHQVLLVGGGRLADAIRAADRHHGLDVERAHWLCVQALEITARLLAELLPEATFTASLTELEQRSQTPGLSVFACESFLREEEPRAAGTRLPHHWGTTSDAIAGRLAVVIAADTLVLLKSVDPPCPGSLRAWAERGFVDAALAALAAELPAIQAVNLRAE